MSDFIQSVDRPDVNGIPPKMKDIAVQLSKSVENLASFLRVSVDDNIMSSVSLRGSFDKREDWSSNIYENSRYFRFMITPPKGQRYYKDGDPIKVELAQKSYKIERKFRAYTGPVDKVIDKIVKWIKEGE